MRFPLPVSVFEIPSYLGILAAEATRTTDVAEVYALRRELEESNPELLRIASFHLRPFIEEEAKQVLQFLNRGNFDKPSTTAILNRIEHFRLMLDQRGPR